MKTHNFSSQRRLSAALCGLVGAGGVVLSSSAQQFIVPPIHLTDGNASADINPLSSDGMFNWEVDGQDYLKQQWLWYRVGNTPERSIDTLTLSSSSQPIPSFATLLYTGGAAGFDIEVRYTLNGGSPGSGTADVSEQFIVRNTSGAQLSLSLFLFSDFDLAGTMVGDTVSSVSYSPFPFSNPGFFEAVQIDGVQQQRTIVGTYADRAEAGGPGATLAKLTDGVASNLANSGSGFGPVGPGDMSYAFQWDLLLPAGGAETIGVDKLLIVPEPAAVSLIIIGLAAIARRRFSPKDS